MTQNYNLNTGTYLTKPEEIKKAIAHLSTHKTLWLDTETAYWRDPNKKRVSLIQILTKTTDKTGKDTYILDVLDQPNLVEQFIHQIMMNPEIEKVFHNAAYDLQFLGKEQAKNITCTLKLSKQLTLDVLGTPDRKLKTLAQYLCGFENIDTEEQGSDWERRPLTKKQLQYAQMDPVYLIHVHQRLLQLMNPNFQPPLEHKTTTVKPFSVTQIRVAFECPRLFYLNYHFGENTLFLPPDHTKGIGSTFHKLAEELVNFIKNDDHIKALFVPPKEELDLEAIASSIQQLFYDSVFYTHLNNSHQANLLLQIWQGLTQLIRKFTSIIIINREYCQANNLLNQTFIEQEYSLNYDFILPNNNQQKVIGKFDNLIFNFHKNSLCVIEYKTYKPADISAQLAQVALYSYILHTQKKVPVDSAVYCVLTQFQEYYYTWEQLENTVNQIIPYKLQQMQTWITWEQGKNDPPHTTTQPALCSICPQQEKCQAFFDTSEKTQSTINNTQIHYAIASEEHNPPKNRGRISN